MATATYASATNNPEIDGLLGNTKWTGTITYSFPDSPSDYAASYYGNNEPLTSGFSSAPVQMQQATTYAVALINSYTNANIQYAGTNGADIMVAQSPAANPTSYAYYPANVPAGGDVWFGTGYNYSLAALGNYYFATALHELGHAVGLKHSQETGGVANVAVPAAHDDSEFSIMSYRSYVGGPLTGYTNEAYGFPQTYMANDILALQTLYGANFSTHSENTVYSWSASTGQMFINGVAQLAPGGGSGGSSNRIFETVWDGNGIDTYDLSNYSGGVSINLNPGASSVTSSTQLAYLGNGHYAQGNIFNAYLYNNDARSYIDNAIGGSGNDSLIGNVIANALYGGGGNDTLSGGGGNDILTGGTGVDVLIGGDSADTFVFAAGDSSAASGQHDRISDFIRGTDHIDISGIDAIASTAALDTFHFLGSGAFDGTAGALDYFYDSSRGVTVLQGDTNGDRFADFAVDLTGSMTLSVSDFTGSVTAAPTVVGPILSIVDYNADGHGDILWQNDDGSLAIWDSGQMSSAHSIAGAGAVPSSSHIVGVGDFDGNGRGDILWRDDNGAVTIWSNGQASAAQTMSAAGAVPTAWQIVGTGDFDGNGRDDILWQNSNGTVSVWDNGQISGGHWISDPGVVASSWHIVTTGDFDGNGRDDILWYNDSGMVSIWDNGQIGGAHIIASGMPSNWHIVSAGDFDGNGRDDILWRNDNGTIALWDNGQIGSAHWISNPGVVPNSTHVGGIGDFDANGHDDILWRDDNGAVSIWDNAQPGTAHTVAAAGSLPSGWHIV
ncbi:Ca2+-binding RTX toxin-like protein [Bradyrhizobium algeriense]|uniref:Ca2+-binding RTX toxin-like protein n=1 Tax=Bradyrhizobium algeriense TaxID=634784 RepID=A0ABU8B6G0_9BRAD